MPIAIGANMKPITGHAKAHNAARIVAAFTVATKCIVARTRRNEQINEIRRAFFIPFAFFASASSLLRPIDANHAAPNNLSYHAYASTKCKTAATPTEIKQILIISKTRPFFKSILTPKNGMSIGFCWSDPGCFVKILIEKRGPNDYPITTN